MFSRGLSRAVVETPWRFPPTFLLPVRARLHTTHQFVESDASNSSLPTGTPSRAVGSTESIKIPGAQQHTELKTASNQFSATNLTSQAPADVPDASNAPLSETVKNLLPSLASQPPHFATIHIHARPYMVTEGDTVQLPFHMPNVRPGDILRLNRASLIGSRDYTLQGQPYVDDRLFECRAVVMGVDSEPMRSKEKTKRRNRRIKTVKSKHRYTKIAVKELRVKELAEVEE